jgi:hypothetical protein
VIIQSLLKDAGRLSDADDSRNHRTSVKYRVLYCLSSAMHSTGVLISPYPDQEGNKLERQKILGFIYPICNHNLRNVTTTYI